MSRLKALVLGMGFLMLSGCDEERPTSIDFGIGALSQSPVVVSVMRIDGVLAYPEDTVRFSGADSTPRQQGATSISGPRGETFTVQSEWTEVLTGRSYVGQTVLAVDALSVEGGTADLVVLLLAGGIMIIGSDPLPKSTEVVTRDIAKVCADRAPDKDRILARQSGTGFIASQNAPAKVADALEFVTKPLIVPPCTGAG